MRDFFFAPNMHGVDWAKVRATYSQLLPTVNHRIDLTYVLGENDRGTQRRHTYVGGGDYPKPERSKRVCWARSSMKDLQAATGGSEDPGGRKLESERSFAVDGDRRRCQEGDYIIASTGGPTSQMTNIYESLVNHAGKQVTAQSERIVEGNGSPANLWSWPIEDEGTGSSTTTGFQNNIRQVSAATDGKVGYVHGPRHGSPRRGTNSSSITTPSSERRPCLRRAPATGVEPCHRAPDHRAACSA